MNAGKGDTPRPIENRQAYDENYERVFGDTIDVDKHIIVGTDIGAFRDLCRTQGYIYQTVKENGIEQEHDKVFHPRRLSVTVESGIIKEVYNG